MQSFYRMCGQGQFSALHLRLGCKCMAKGLMGVVEVGACKARPFLKDGRVRIEKLRLARAFRVSRCEAGRQSMFDPAK
jgi:hypothetical protein